MPQPLLNSFKHHCFHGPRCNVHKHPDLYRCARGSAHEALLKTTTAHVVKHSDPGVECPACADVAVAAAAGASPCTAAIRIDMAKQAALVDSKGNVSCPICGGPTVLVPGETKAEVHVKVCTDETIHSPQMRKAGTITEAQYQEWKASLTHDERCGVYKRVPDIHVMASFTHDETALMTSDPAAFAALANTRIAERAEAALLHQVPYRHQTTSPVISL